MRRIMASLWQREFARNLSREAGIRVKIRDLRTEATRLPKDVMPGDDGAKQFNLTLSRTLHAAVLLLERDHAIPSTEARRIAGTALVASGTWLACGAVRLWLKMERDPLGGVMRRGPSRVARAMWGNGMVVEDRSRPDGVSLCVLACPFHDYFSNVGRTDLTPLLCAWDTAWQNEVNASARPIRVDVRSTIARGGDMCEFFFGKPTPADAERMQ
jgi:hypothetical protein